MKQILALLLALLLCLGLTACGRERPEEISNSSAEAGATEDRPAAGEEEKKTEPSASGDGDKQPEEAPVEAEQTPKEDEKTEEEQPEPVLTEINHCVLDPEHLAYITDEKLAAYQKAMDAILAHEEQVTLTDSYDDNLSVYGYLKDNPYTFVLADLGFTDDHTGLWFTYNYSAEEITDIVETIDGEYLTLINQCIRTDMTELEMVLAIHKYFAERIEYDYEWVEEMNAAVDVFMYPDLVLYEALTTDKGVCHTYTYLCQFAFEQLGIGCIRLSGAMWNSDAYHMWPLVWIDGQAYHLDPTWDREDGQAALRYFGMTDEENYSRGCEYGWSVDIDLALDGSCNDGRFSGWRDIVSYELIGNHQMEVLREDGSREILDLTEYQG